MEQIMPLLHKFNINDYVYVQLTKRGHKILEDRHMEVFGPMIIDYPYRRKTEDEKGWSQWQLHDLMKTFGEHMYLGNADMPFKTEIRFEESK